MSGASGRWSTWNQGSPIRATGISRTASVNSGSRMLPSGSGSTTYGVPRGIRNGLVPPVKYTSGGSRRRSCAMNFCTGE